ncbi:MAG: arginine--tRNA ligase [Spirochaetes bacterium]|uniref:Arginine--tRNA ligase n=1 Tax=Candidatus Ornithospirochaeta stercoripullorum TaxID=2840899 RepID=A0A9D9DY63_9SPIO|nr:arginine--tRNA ligase [Candidatus Ornithospirochaeta stercoripullorum]
MLTELKNEWKKAIEEELKSYLKCDSIPALAIGVPPKSEMGDAAFPLFPYAKAAGKAPALIAKDIMASLAAKQHPAGEMLLAGPYLNIRFDIPSLAGKIIEDAISSSDNYGRTEDLSGKKIMVEFSCPNTNKPLHLGHMRNDSLGESVSELLKAAGADVMKVNLINNRGVHICKSMLAYKLFGNGETPESTGEKGDHFVGRYYVRFAQWEKEVSQAKEADPSIVSDPSFIDPDQEAQKMLRLWEAGDAETRSLWEKMNKWTLDGLAESYKNMGISFDKLYYESETYKLGRSEVMKGLEMGVFKKEEDGSVQVDLSPIGLDKKVLLRRDGTTLYMTQDIGTAVKRHEDWPFDSLIYVVASEQNYHFKVLFYVLGLLGYKWAEELHHLSYGMVNLPDGKMKSREGTVVDADDLLSELTVLARSEIEAKGREEAVGNVDDTARKIALGALNYYLLQVQPQHDMVFDSKKSISFNGNTGPYLQYTCARISSILRRYEEDKESYDCSFDASQLTLEDEKILLKAIESFPDTVRKAALSYDPSIIASYLYENAKTFSHYYHDNQILKAETKELSLARIRLISALRVVMKNGFALIGVPYLESM